MDTNVILEDVVRILEIKIIGLGIPVEKDSSEAYWPAKITWCKVGTNPSVLTLAFEEFTYHSIVLILNWTQQVEPGIYRRVRGTPEIDTINEFVLEPAA